MKQTTNKKLTKKLFTTIALLVLLVAFIPQFNLVHAADESTVDTEKALIFLQGVIKLDMTKYETTLIDKGTEYLPWLGEVAQTDGQYRLDATGSGIPSILTVTFTFFDKQLIALSIHEESQGPSLYKEQPATDLRDAVLDFLQRYQMHTSDAQITQMGNILETIEATSNTTKTVDNLSLAVFVENDRTVFTWSNTINDAGYSRLKIEFQNGQFSRFYDNRRSYKLGSSEVNISQEDAISIALEYAESVSYMYDEKEIADFNIVKEAIRSPKLDFLNKTSRWELFPCWIIDLPLDTIYPGQVSYIEVMLWADSGEVVSCEPLGYGFPYTPTPTLVSTQSAGNTQTDNNMLSVIYIVAACLATLIPIAVVGIVLKRKSKSTQSNTLFLENR